MIKGSHDKNLMSIYRIVAACTTHVPSIPRAESHKETIIYRDNITDAFAAVQFVKSQLISKGLFKVFICTKK